MQRHLERSDDSRRGQPGTGRRRQELDSPGRRGAAGLQRTLIELSPLGSLQDASLAESLCLTKMCSVLYSVVSFSTAGSRVTATGGAAAACGWPAAGGHLGAGRSTLVRTMRWQPLSVMTTPLMSPTSMCSRAASKSSSISPGWQMPVSPGNQPTLLPINTCMLLASRTSESQRGKRALCVDFHLSRQHSRRRSRSHRMQSRQFCRLARHPSVH